MCVYGFSARDEYNDTLKIVGIEELMVSRQDLQESGKPVEFVKIEKLDFSGDLDEEAFKKIAGIVKCGTVSFPKLTIPKLHVYANCIECDKVIILEK